MESDDKEIEKSEEDFEVLEDSVASSEPDEKLSGQLNYSNNLYDKNNINPISNNNDASNLSSKIGKANSFLNGLNNIKEVNMDSDEEENRTSSLPKNDSLEESKNRNKGNLGNTINQRLKNIAKKQANKKINLIKTKILIKYVLPAVLVLALALVIIFTIASYAKNILAPYSFLISFFYDGADKDEYTNEDGFANELYEIIDKDKAGKDPKEMTTEEVMQYFLMYNSCDDEFFVKKFWDFIRPGYQSICELYRGIRNRIEEKESKANVTVSYGLIIGTLVNGYNYEREFLNTLDENGDTIYNVNKNDESAKVYGDSAFPSQIIYDIKDGTGNIKVSDDSDDPDDLNAMLNNMIFHEEYTIYTYEVEEVDIVENGVISGVKYYHKCSGKKVNDTYLDYQKYLIFLRYGESRAEKYQEYYNLNKSWEHSDEQCKLSMDFTNKEETTTIPVLAGDPGFDENNLGQTRTWTIKEIYMQSYKQANESFKMCGDRMTDYIDISDLYETADFETNDLDVLTNSYSDGFMAQKFNNIQEGASDTTDKFFVKNLEKYIREIIEYAIDMDETLGIEADFMSSYFDSKGGLIPNYNCSDKKNSGTCSEVDDIRITSCPVSYATTIDPLKNDRGTFKGGAIKWRVLNGFQLYKASETIDLKEYIFGVTYAEIGVYINRGNIEAIKAFMIMAMSYALSPDQYDYNRVSQNSDGLYLPCDDYCFQVYYASSALGSEQISVLEEAYEEAKNYRLFTKNTDNIFMCEYLADQQNLLVDLVESNPGITFEELLEHPDFIASNSKYQNYELKTCKGSSAEVGDFIYYNQKDYGGLLCGNSDYGSFANNGCGVTSMAIAAANVKNDSSITPDEIQKYMCSSTTHELIGFGAVEGNYDLSVSAIGLDEVTGYLDNGCMVIVGGYEGVFSSVHHYVVIAKHDGDNVFILDPYWTDNNGWLSGTTDFAVSGKEYNIKDFDGYKIESYTAVCG